MAQVAVPNVNQTAAALGRDAGGTNLARTTSQWRASIQSHPRGAVRVGATNTDRNVARARRETSKTMGG